MIRQHNPARTDADPGSDHRDVSDHDFWGGTRDAWNVVVFGQPIARIAELISQASQVQGVAQRLGIT